MLPSIVVDSFSNDNDPTTASPIEPIISVPLLVLPTKTQDIENFSKSYVLFEQKSNEVLEQLQIIQIELPRAEVIKNYFLTLIGG
jgi:hypothetical protein